jgi:hypothetical protein
MMGHDRWAMMGHEPCADSMIVEEAWMVTRRLIISSIATVLSASEGGKMKLLTGNCLCLLVCCCKALWLPVTFVANRAASR